MPWRDLSPMSQRRRFIDDYLRRPFSMTELCERYGISRKTGYKWLQRFAEEGVEGLRDRSRRPLNSPHETPDYIVAAILEARRLHPRWGAEKLLWLLEQRHKRWRFPAGSTVCDILKRNGMVPRRPHRRKPGHPGKPLTPANAPNEIWTADFKGHFKTRDGVYCYPLTVVDKYSRYILACHGQLTTSHGPSQDVFRRLFRKYGLPEIIRTDNGVPFATQALGRLSRLSVWWIRLGIFPELIEPSHPEQNARHERMHRTLKDETTRPPARNLTCQRRRFTRFVGEYNEERPHEALGQELPAKFYTPSPQPYPVRLPPLEYPGHYEVRLVSRNGGIRWNNHRVPVSHVLMEQYIGFEEIDNGLWEVYYGHVRLGRFDERLLRIVDDQGRTMRRRVLPMSPD